MLNQLVIERVEHGIDPVKELLSKLTSDQRWGVMLEFKEVSPDRFTQLLADASQWVEWMA